MAQVNIGRNRSSAIWRVLGLFVIAVATPVIGTVAIGAALVYMVIDVLKRIFTDRGASGNGLIMGSLKGVFLWYVKLIKWIAIGREFPGFLPRRA